MALISCPECGKEISNKSQTCIYCGCPIHGVHTSNDFSHDIASFRVDLRGDYWASITSMQSPQIRRITLPERAILWQQGQI